MKNLFLISAAALAFCACSNDEKIAENSASTQPQEIAFMPIAQPNTRAQYSVTTTSFPDDNTMEVKAYLTQPSAGGYFEKCTFSKGDGTTWKGGKYWPLSDAKINFFAVSGYNLTVSHITIADALASATVNYTTANSYSQTTQSDIMYAFGRGEVTKTGNAIAFNGGNAVSMQFKHALALVDFQVKGATSTETSAITVNSITLKDAKYNGTLTLTNTNASSESGEVTTAVSWSADEAVTSVVVPGISSGTVITADYARIGNGLMIIPGTGFTSFVINYSMNGNSYDYEYTPSPAVSSTTANNKYTYQITFKMHEIEIAPTVAEWTNTNTPITIVE